MIYVVEAMHTIIICFSIAALTAAGLSAQMPEEVKLDTPQAKASLLTLEPHHPSTPREYPLQGILVFLESGQMTLTSSSGKAEKISFKAGDFHWIPSAGPYVSENIGDRGFRLIDIQLKSRPAGPLPATDMDPVKVDPAHYRVEFENDQVRVLRVRYGPHEKGALHEHKLNRVVCYITDHPSLKAGSVRMSGAARHTEENSMDQAVERLAVELK